MAHILVVEDNAPNQELMVYLLRAFGHVVTAASDGAEGLAAASHDAPDLVICDVHLPKLDGREVARCLRDDPQLRAIPLIAVTALAMVGDREKLLSAGFDGYISKPISPDIFVSQVEAFLPEAHRHQAVRPRPPVTAAGAPVAHPHGHATILVVDDSDTNRDLMRSMLEPFGFKVVGVRSVEAGLAVARRSSPSLIISDLHMPSQDGFALIKAVRADVRLTDIPFIIASSSAWNAADRRRALALGADCFLQRPIEPQELVTAVRQCLRD